SLIAGLASASIIQTVFLVPIFGKTPAPTVEIAVEVRLLRIGLKRFIDNDDLDSRSREALLASSEPGSVRLSDKEVLHLLENLQGKRNSDTMQAPRITVPDGRSGTCHITKTQYFVTDVVRVKSTEGQLVDVPKNEAFETGLRVFVR